MKILAFSDSHRRTLGIYSAIERERPDAVIHLGDCVEDAHDLIRSYPYIPIWYVRGNNDFEQEALFRAIISPEGMPMYLTHGHKERVSRSSIGILPRKARENGCRVALFGHTHRLFCTEIDGVLVLNPGSISLPRGGPASYMRIVMGQGHLQEIAALDEDGQLYKKIDINTGWI